MVVSCRVIQLSIYFVWCRFLSYCRPAGREFQNRPRPTIVGTETSRDLGGGGGVPVRVVKGKYPHVSEGCYTWRSRVVGSCRAQGCQYLLHRQIANQAYCYLYSVRSSSIGDCILSKSHINRGTGNMFRCMLQNASNRNIWSYMRFCPVYWLYWLLHGKR